MMKDAPFLKNSWSLFSIVDCNSSPIIQKQNQRSCAYCQFLLKGLASCKHFHTLVSTFRHQFSQIQPKGEVDPNIRLVWIKADKREKQNTDSLSKFWSQMGQLWILEIVIDEITQIGNTVMYYASSSPICSVQKISRNSRNIFLSYRGCIKELPIWVWVISPSKTNNFHILY